MRYPATVNLPFNHGAIKDGFVAGYGSGEIRVDEVGLVQWR